MQYYILVKYKVCSDKSIHLDSNRGRAITVRSWWLTIVFSVTWPDWQREICCEPRNIASKTLIHPLAGERGGEGGGGKVGDACKTVHSHLITQPPLKQTKQNKKSPWNLFIRNPADSYRHAWLFKELGHVKKKNHNRNNIHSTYSYSWLSGTAQNEILCPVFTGKKLFFHFSRKIRAHPGLMLNGLQESMC